MLADEATKIIAYWTVVLGVATVLLFLATAALVAVAWSQLRAERIRRLETETLRVCNVYDTDPILAAACRRIWDASDGGRNYTNNPKIDKHDVITVANYLDGIAIGVLQHLYSDRIACDHLGNVIKKFVDIILPQTVDNLEGYEALIRVSRDWHKPAPTVQYSSR